MSTPLVSRWPLLNAVVIGTGTGLAFGRFIPWYKDRVTSGLDRLDSKFNLSTGQKAVIGVSYVTLEVVGVLMAFHPKVGPCNCAFSHWAVWLRSSLETISHGKGQDRGSDRVKGNTRAQSDRIDSYSCTLSSMYRKNASCVMTPVLSRSMASSVSRIGSKGKFGSVRARDARSRPTLPPPRSAKAQYYGLRQ